MATTSLGLLVAGFDIADAARGAADDGYGSGRLPGPGEVPGLLTLERWIRVDDPDLALVTCDLRSVDVVQGAVDRAQGPGDASPWWPAVTSGARRPPRFVGEQIVPGDALAPAGAGGLLFMGFDLEPGAEADYAAWMDREHLPGLSRVPGVLGARRFVATGGGPRYLAVYHLATPEVCGCEAWLAARETPWTHRIRLRTRDRLRIVCRRWTPA